MKLKIDETEHVLRSVGDPPNGIVAIAMPDDVVTLIITPKGQPEPVEGPGATVRIRSSDDGMAEGATPITAAEAVEACAGVEEATLLFTMVATSGKAMYDVFIPAAEIEAYSTFFSLLIDLRDALLVRFGRADEAA